MKKGFLISIPLLISLFMSFHAYSQVPASGHLINDSTPIEKMDYKISKEEFMYYYGTDDTARALIHLFFRKRTNAIVNIFAPGAPAYCFIGGSFLIPDLVDFAISESFYTPYFLLADFAIGVIYTIRGVVQRLNYTKKDLLYILVDKERGGTVYQGYIWKLGPIDFSGSTK